MDLQNILLLTSNKIDNDLKGDLYNYLSFLDMDNLNIDKKKMTNLLKIIQEVLRFKGEQVGNTFFQGKHPFIIYWLFN